MKEVLIKVLINHIIPDTYVVDSHQFFPEESEKKEFLTSNIAILANLRKQFINSSPQENRAKLDNIEKLIVELVGVDDFSRYFHPQETEYFKILKKSKVHDGLDELAGLVGDHRVDIMYRLYAFMLLEVNGYPLENKSAIVNGLISDFKTQIKNNSFYSLSLTLTVDMLGMSEDIRDGLLTLG